MTTEQKKDKKNMDYSASAVLLNNSPTVKEALDKYHALQADADNLRAELEQTVLWQQWTASCDLMTAAAAEVKGAIELYGSYQDVDAGHYAVKQIKHSRQYHAQPFIERYPKYAPAVIEQTINVKALEGLIKGKLLDETGLKIDGVITLSEYYAYIVR